MDIKIIEKNTQITYKWLIVCLVYSFIFFNLFCDISIFSPTPYYFSIFGSFGPYIALGLFGNSTLKDYEDFNINNIFSDQVYKRFDYGIGANIGIEINHHWQIGMGVSFSLLKPTKGEWNAINPKDSSFNTSLAYIF